MAILTMNGVVTELCIFPSIKFNSTHAYKMVELDNILILFCYQSRFLFQLKVPLV